MFDSFASAVEFLMEATFVLWPVLLQSRYAPDSIMVCNVNNMMTKYPADLLAQAQKLLGDQEQLWKQ